MDLQHAIDLLDLHLLNEPKTRALLRAHNEVTGVWIQDEFRADVSPAGSTGFELRLCDRGRPIHERIFASSPVSIPRMAQAIVEHLTGYKK